MLNSPPAVELDSQSEVRRRTLKERIASFFRPKGSIAGRPSETPAIADETERRSNLYVYWMLVLPVLGATGIIVRGVRLDSSAFTLLELFLAGASCVVGVLVGFLFGVPRTFQDETPRRDQSADSQPSQTNRDRLNVDYRFNTNLEQISDWLTKIIVGVGLVEIRKIGGALSAVGQAVADSLRGSAPSGGQFEGVMPFSVAVLVFYFVCGFLGSYLWTRLEYGGMLARSDVNTLGRIGQSVKQLERLTTAAISSRSELAHDKQPGLAAQKAFTPPPEWPPDLRKKLQDYLAFPASWTSDPAAEMFGHRGSAANGWRLSAQVKPVSGRTHLVTLTLEADQTVRLPQQVVLLLHPSYPERAQKFTVTKSPAELNILAEGAYTVAVITDGGHTILTYNLAAAPGATPEFISS